MPIPKIIEELFGARYDWQMAAFDEKAKMQSRFETLRSQAAKEYQCSEMELWLAAGKHYRAWVRQNKLPQPPKE